MLSHPFCSKQDRWFSVQLTNRAFVVEIVDSTEQRNRETACQRTYRQAVHIRLCLFRSIQYPLLILTEFQSDEHCKRPRERKGFFLFRTAAIRQNVDVVFVMPSRWANSVLVIFCAVIIWLSLSAGVINHPPLRLFA